MHSDRLLFDETFAQPCVFAVVNCADAARSVFHSLFQCVAGYFCSYQLLWIPVMLYVHYSDKL